MNGIKEQFASSPGNPIISNITISVSGTVSALMTGSYATLMWRIKAPATNSGDVFVSTRSNGATKFTMDAGDDTGWIPGTLQQYYYWGDTANDRLELWELR